MSRWVSLGGAKRALLSGSQPNVPIRAPLSIGATTFQKIQQHFYSKHDYQDVRESLITNDQQVVTRSLNSLARERRLTRRQITRLVRCFRNQLRKKWKKRNGARPSCRALAVSRRRVVFPPSRREDYAARRSGRFSFGASFG